MGHGAEAAGVTFTNPIPGASWKNNGGYDADSGLDILVDPGTSCVAAASGVVEYAEPGHTPWVEDTDPNTPGFQGPWSVRIRLSSPVVVNGKKYPWIWYTHLQSVDPSIRNQFEVPISAGAPIGKTGVGNKVPHLHFGILADQAQNNTLRWQDVAHQIWGDPGAPPRPASEPAHGLDRVIKLFVNSDSGTLKASLVEGDRVTPLKDLQITVRV